MRRSKNYIEDLALLSFEFPLLSYYPSSTLPTMRSVAFALVALFLGSASAFQSAMPRSVAVRDSRVILDAHHVQNKGAKKARKNRPKKVSHLPILFTTHVARPTAPRGVTI